MGVKEGAVAERGCKGLGIWDPAYVTPGADTGGLMRKNNRPQEAGGIKLPPPGLKLPRPLPVQKGKSWTLGLLPFKGARRTWRWVGPPGLTWVGTLQKGEEQKSYGNKDGSR